LASYNNGSAWLISLQAPDIWEAVAAALAEGFGGHSADLKYRFAKVLRARRDEVATILAEDGIPGYRIKEALHDFDGTEDEEEVAEEAAAVGPGQGASGAADDGDAQESGLFDDNEEEDEGEEEAKEASGASDGRDQADRRRDQADRRGDGSECNGHRSGAGRPTGRLTRRKLFGGGRNHDENEGRSRREAAEVAKAVAVRGMRAEAWLMQ
jgi:hypothetical protein